MKNWTKILCATGLAIVLGVGAVTVYWQAQQTVPLESKLTLANIEAMAFDPSDGETGIFWGNCFGYDALCSVVCPKCKYRHYTTNEGVGIIEGGYCDNCLSVYPN